MPDEEKSVEKLA